jgi:hypothetical protein
MLANPGASTYSVNPGTQSGSGAFGNVPGQLSLPDPYADLAGVFPTLPQANNVIGQNVLQELSGNLSPGTLSALNQMQGQLGQSGALNTSPMSLGTTDTQLENLGLGQYEGVLPTVAQTQTVNPALETEIAQTNAVDSAAPNPEMAAIANLLAGLAGEGVSMGMKAAM